MKNDVRTVTGSNLRNILRMTNLSNIDDMTYHSVKSVRYYEADETENWRLLIMEIMDIKFGALGFPHDWTVQDLDEILKMACV